MRRRFSALSIAALTGFFALLHVIAIVVFAKGFLLTRVELPNISSCALPEHLQDKSAELSGCWSEKRFEKVVVVIIDALRFDFLVSEDGQDDEHVAKMPKLLGMHKLAGASSILAKFVADPPTTTMQRLKGMLTGGLPTFLDVGSSFSASAISEDNLINQIKFNDGKVAVVGDDTWEQLFPDLLDISLPFPSFNVRDLHTVDNGVWEHLIPLAMNKTDKWDLLVGHYLGVDHAGHTFGVRTPEMSEKLKQMDDQMCDLILTLLGQGSENQRHSKTLLIIMGDHGQTLNGDHGGGTPEETDSALVAFDIGTFHENGIKLMDNGAHEGSDIWNLAALKKFPYNLNGNEKMEWSEIPQIDFAPTLSMLLGLPIPFGSVGKISRPLWMLGQNKDNDLSLKNALRINAWQVHNYLRMYGNHAKLSAPRLSELNAMYKDTQKDSNNARELLAFLDAAAAFAREQWTQFDDFPMVLGLLILGGSLALQLRTIGLIRKDSIPESKPPHITQGPIFGSTSTIHGSFILIMSILHGIALLSNSYIMAEGRMTSFLLASATLLLIRAKIGSKFEGKMGREGGSEVHEGFVNGWMGFWGRSRDALMYGGVVLFLNACMERQGLIDRTGANPFDKQTQGGDSDHSNWIERIMLYASISASCFILSHNPPKKWRQLSNNTNGRLDTFSYITVLVSRWGVWTNFLLLGLYWALHDAGLTVDASIASIFQFSMPMDYQFNSWLFRIPLIVLIPRLIYITSILIIILVIMAMCLRRCRKVEDGVGFLFNAFTALIGAIFVPVALVSGRVGCIAGFMAMLQFACFSKLASNSSTKTNDNPQTSGIISMESLSILLSFYAMQMFFFTGHFCEFSGLQYHAAFIGFPEFSFYVCGALLALNTFGSHILVTLLVPYITLYIHHHDASIACSDRAQLNTTPQSVSNMGKSIKLALLVSMTVRTHNAWVCMLSSAIQKRHLLVWAIFAPKFVFEVCFLLVTDLGILFVGWIVGGSLNGKTKMM